MHKPPSFTGCPEAPSSWIGHPSRSVTDSPHPAGHSVQVEGEKIASPGMIPSSGGRMEEMNFFDPLPEPQEEIRVEPVRTPTIRKKSLRFILKLPLLVAGGAVPGRPLGPVAGNAPSHFQRADPADLFHRAHHAVTFRTVHPRPDVPLVGKVDVFRQRVAPDPQAGPFLLVLRGELPALPPLRRDRPVAGHPRSQARSARVPRP